MRPSSTHLHERMSRHHHIPSQYLKETARMPGRLLYFLMGCVVAGRLTGDLKVFADNL
jgi:hypothetical protein